MIIDPEKHFFLTSSGQIDEIIKPLKDHFGINSFVYFKNFNDGSEIRLTNQPEWIQYYYEQGLYKLSYCEGRPSDFVKARLIWAGITVANPVLEKARQFNIDHGMTFVEPCADGCEFFFIGTALGRADVMSKYLSNIDLLERFLDYFRVKAKPLIDEASKHKIIIPGKFEAVSQTFCLQDLNRTDFLNAISPVEFSARELECMRLLAKGYTQKMIAKELGISPRTVETYLNHVKEKTGSYSKGDLVKYLLKMPV
jgi:DNA-binding CsgD family transcriptional regulator